MNNTKQDFINHMDTLNPTHLWEAIRGIVSDKARLYLTESYLEGVSFPGLTMTHINTFNIKYRQAIQQA